MIKIKVLELFYYRWQGKNYLELLNSPSYNDTKRKMSYGENKYEKNKHSDGHCFHAYRPVRL